ncbi:MAG: DUF429 domain-containing protein, partial [Actinomycetes bacterium]
MTRVLGVDGCRGGWLGALVDGTSVTWLRLPDVTAVLAVDASAIGIDMPVGLPPRGRRQCDLAAKRLLGRAHPRVFLTPPRGVLTAGSYVEAGALHRALADGKGMSVQTWQLVAKVREVDARADDPRLVEVHPELSFALLAGRVLSPKRTRAGREERLDALRPWLPDLADVPPGDDAPDALAAAWSALRWHT